MRKSQRTIHAEDSLSNICAHRGRRVYSLDEFEIVCEICGEILRDWTIAPQDNKGSRHFIKRPNISHWTPDAKKIHRERLEYQFEQAKNRDRDSRRPL
jgi:hypothetical protein